MARLRKKKKILQIKSKFDQNKVVIRQKSCNNKVVCQVKIIVEENYQKKIIILRE